MKTAILCFSENGLKLAEGLAKSLDGETTVRFKEHDDLGTLFKESDALIFICAAGIAVRLVAPYLESKTTDPAVLVIDGTARNLPALGPYRRRQRPHKRDCRQDRRGSGHHHRNRRSRKILM